MFSRKGKKMIATIAAAIVVAGGAYGIVSATAGNGSSTATTAASPLAASGRSPARGGGSNARSGPAAGGAIGTVVSVSRSTLTISTAAGQKLTVDKVATTTYRKGSQPTTASAVKKNERVLVLGTVNGTAVTATQIVVEPASATSTTETVVPFQRGAPSTSKQVGQIPANYTQGAGTIVGGRAANNATEAALTVYPGGIVDRVVKLSNGEYEVHNIGVNWPHHIFVNQNFKVVGAD